MKSFLSFSALMLVLISGISQATNTEKYWTTRERLREHFMRVGALQGMSLPASTVVPGYPYGNDNLVHLRDVTLSLGHYWTVLSTEYHLLNSNNQNFEGTLNELYFALNAFDRIDRVAESYLFGAEENTDGFFIKDDVDIGQLSHFQGSPPLNQHIFPNSGPVAYMWSDKYPFGATGQYNDSLKEEQLILDVESLIKPGPQKGETYRNTRQVDCLALRPWRAAG